MGYDTYFNMCLTLKKKLPKKDGEWDKSFLKKFCDSPSAIYDHIDIEKDGKTIQMQESFRSSGSEEVQTFCDRIQHLLEDDSVVNASGEETGDIWRMRFKDGKMVAEHALADVYDLWDEFFARYGDKMPAKLKSDLEEFKKRIEFAESV
jgi:hypothetical protein